MAAPTVIKSEYVVAAPGTSLLRGRQQEKTMESIGFAVARIPFAFLAARFGRDRPGNIRSDDCVLADHDLARSDRVPGPPGESPAPTGPFPTLAFIERAIGGAGPALTASPHAPALESRARDLASEYWGDTVWTTGTVSATAFHRVLGELAPDVLRDWDDSEPPPATSGPTPHAVAEPTILDAPAGGAAHTAA
jgi:hypothetical protein